jgi:hypothetical protein
MIGSDLRQDGFVMFLEIPISRTVSFMIRKPEKIIMGMLLWARIMVLSLKPSKLAW